MWLLMVVSSSSCLLLINNKQTTRTAQTALEYPLLILTETAPMPPNANPHVPVALFDHPKYWAECYGTSDYLPTSQPFRQLLQKHAIRASMSGVGACWDNAVVERFFGSLKNEWLLKVYHLTRQGMKQDVEHYIRYYNQQRLHSANSDLSPVEFELSQMKVSGFA